MSNLTLNLGIDFGTSFTKVVVRDADQDRSWIVTFSKNNHCLNEALLPSTVGICQDGTLIAGLTTDEWKEVSDLSVSIDFIKMRLANFDLQEEGQGHISDSLNFYQGIDLNTSENLENLCAYYLSQVIIKSQKWILSQNAELVKDKQISWSINVGVPVKYFDSQAITRFKKVLRLAWLLNEAPCHSFYELQTVMNLVRKKLEDLEKHYSDEQIPLPCFAFPEIGAAVYSYTVSRQAEPGIYVFFDVGSGTIEGSAFRFWREEGQTMVEFYSGEVEPIGVNGLAKQIATNSLLFENEIINDIINNSEWLLAKIYKFSHAIPKANIGEHIANKTRISIEKVLILLEQHIKDIKSVKLLHLIRGQHLIHKQVSKVILNCKKKVTDDLTRLPKLRIFLGGGGANSEFYRDTIKTTHEAFGHEYNSIPLYDVQNVPFPKDFNMSGISQDNFDRFAIAYGLSIPDYEAPEVIGFPKQFPDAPPPPSFARPERETGYYPDDNSSM